MKQAGFTESQESCGTDLAHIDALDGGGDLDVPLREDGAVVELSLKEVSEGSVPGGQGGAGRRLAAQLNLRLSLLLLLVLVLPVLGP